MVNHLLKLKMTKNKNEIKDIGEAYKKVYSAIKKLHRHQAITILESMKLDIMLNGGVIRLDGKEGQLHNDKK